MRTRTEKSDPHLIEVNVRDVVRHQLTEKLNQKSLSLPLCLSLSLPRAVCSMPVLFLMAPNENQLQGSLNQHNKHNFWHFSDALLEECGTQLLRGVRGVGTLAEVSVGQALGQVGV